MSQDNLSYLGSASEAELSSTSMQEDQIKYDMFSREFQPARDSVPRTCSYRQGYSTTGQSSYGRQSHFPQTPATRAWGSAGTNPAVSTNSNAATTTTGTASTATSYLTIPASPTSYLPTSDIWTRGLGIHQYPKKSISEDVNFSLTGQASNRQNGSRAMDQLVKNLVSDDDLGAAPTHAAQVGTMLGRGGGNWTYSNNPQLQQAYRTPQSKPQPSQAAASQAPPGSSYDALTNEELVWKLRMKDSMICQLKDQIDVHKARAAIVTSLKEAERQKGFEIPKNYEQLYEMMVEKLQSTEKELVDTKLRLESVMTAIALNPSTGQTRNGRYDEQEIAHKIVTKLQMLTSENSQLAKMLSYGKAKEKDIELGLLRLKNNELQEKLSKAESKLQMSK